MDLRETKEGLFLPVKVIPKSRQNGLVGWENGLLKVKVHAPPEKGEANLAVVLLLARILHLPQKNIILVQGSTSRTKLFCLEGISKEQLLELVKKNS